MSIPHHSTHTDALSKLLATGASQADAARSLGISQSAVTQLISTPTVQAAIQAHTVQTELDDQYDRIEKKLLDQLERTTPLLMRPMEIAKVLTTVNGAKRRGGPLVDNQAPPKILQLNLPIAIQTRFVVNSSNQVVSAGSQDLVTLPSANVTKLLEEKKHHALPLNSLTSGTEEDEYGFPVTTSTR